MTANVNQKLKLLYIMKILFERTDEKNKVTVNEIIEELHKYGISAERKSVYTDIDLLKEFGIDVLCEKSRANKYFIASRDFELAELKLLVDAVQSSKFITQKKSKKLIEKIEKLTSIHEAKELDRNVVCTDYVKAMNENVFYNVDKLHEAILNDKQVKFKYFEYDLNKEIKLRRDGEWYYASPYALTWSEENYYLIAYYEKYDNITNFRVDRMLDINVVDMNRICNDEINIAEYMKKIFKMYSGDTEKVKLKFDNSLINVVIDRFGKDVFIYDRREDSFCITVEVIVSNTFLAWLFMFGDKVMIIEPGSLRDRMRERVREVLYFYE